MNELENMRMAGISAAALGYWKEGESIHPDYDTVALRDVAKLYAKCERMRAAIVAAMDELGVPGEGYPAPVTNAYDILWRARYEGLECIVGDDDYRPKEPQGATPEAVDGN